MQNGKLIIVILKMFQQMRMGPRTRRSDNPSTRSTMSGHSSQGRDGESPDRDDVSTDEDGSMGRGYGSQSMGIILIYPQMKMGPWGKVTVPGVGMKAPLSGIGMSLLRVIMFM